MSKEGTVKFFNETKGFGFIIPATTGEEEVFVHSSGLIDQIRKTTKLNTKLSVVEKE